MARYHPSAGVAIAARPHLAREEYEDIPWHVLLVDVHRSLHRGTHVVGAGVLQVVHLQGRERVLVCTGLIPKP